MILKELFVSNFKTLNFDSPLKLSEGVTLVLGRNESGKSSILDAILYALFGSVIKPKVKPSRKDLVRYGQKKAFVRLDFMVDATDYRVERTIHLGSEPTEAVLFVKEGKGFRATATSVREVSASVGKILGGITYQEIIASNIVAQKDLSHLINKSVNDRKAIINIFLNLNSYNKVASSFKEEINSIKGTRTKKGELVVEKELLTVLQVQLKGFRNKVKEYSATKTAVEQLNRDFIAVKNAYLRTEKLHKTLTNYDSTLAQKIMLQKKIVELQKIQETIQKQLSVIAEKEQKLAKLKQTLSSGNFELAKKELGKGQAFVDIERDLQTKAANKRQDIVECNKMIEELERKIPNSKALSRTKKFTQIIPFMILFALGSLLSGLVLSFLSPGLIAYLLLAVTLIPLIVGAFAYYKKRTLRNSFEIKAEIDRFKKQAAGYTAALEEIQDQKEANQQRFRTFLESVSNYSTLYSTTKTPSLILTLMMQACFEDEKEVTRLKTEVKLLTQDLDTKEQIIAENQRISTELEKLRADLEAIELPVLPENLAFSREKITQTKKHLEKYRDEIMKLSAKAAEKELRGKQLREELAASKGIEERFEAQQKVVRNLQHKLAVLRLALEGIHKTTHLLREQVRPNVQNYMSSFLPVMTSNKYRAVKIDENYNLSVWEPSAGMFKERAVFSGGTEDQLLLAMRLSFALALLPESKGSYPSFLFLDEPFASSDTIRRENILSLINTTLSQRFKQIFLVSHINESEFDFIVDTTIRLVDGRIIKQ